MLGWARARACFFIVERILDAFKGVKWIWGSGIKRKANRKSEWCKERRYQFIRDRK
jgi:hypothetical protein